ncbi:hypothetical protein MNBD_GAMMA06-24 [hydrothermal vent metagenome]|uniref:Uncharacterized protein n=1 Tax=hydrothermal vent metagenome TaxID=652676 RepID=A0A3B0WRI6_9ZZZZ
MRSNTRQFDCNSWLIFTGPIVVFAHKKNVMKNTTKIAAGHASAYSRDGPIIFHMRDGPPHVTGPPGGTDSPRFTSESGPPKTTGPPMEWLARKKSLKKH